MATQEINKEMSKYAQICHIQLAKLTEHKLH